MIRAGGPARSRFTTTIVLLLAAASCHRKPPAATPTNRPPTIAPGYFAEVVDAAEGRSSLAVRGPCPAGTCDRGIVDLGTGRARLVGLLDLQGKPASFTPFSDHRAIAPGISQSLGAHARLPAALVIVEHDDAAGAHRADLEVIDLRPTPPNRILDVELTLQQADGGGFAAKHVELSGADADAPLGISITQVTLPGSHDLVAPSQQLVRHRFVLAEGRYIRLE